MNWKTRLTYGLGDWGQNVIFQAAGFYLLLFYTDYLGIEAGFAGSLFLVARIWDGINDPLMGYLAQRTQTRWGSYRPFLLFAALPLGGSMFGLFYAPALEGTALHLYVAAMYLLYGLAFTVYNVPYGALTAAMTSSYEERGKLTGFRMSFAMLGGLMGASLMLPLVEAWGGGRLGFARTGAFWGLLIALASLLTFWGVREKRPPGSPTVPDLRGSFRTLRANRPFWLLCLCFGACFAALGVYSAILTYACTYVWGDAGLTSKALLVMMGTTGLSVPVWTWFSRRYGKRQAFLWGALAYLLAYAGLFWLPAGAFGWLYALLVVQGIGNGAAAFTSWAMLPDTLEYGQWQTGRRTEGVSYGLYGFCLKLGLGLGAALAGWGLSLSGYVPLAVQSDSTQLGIRLLLCGLPFGLVLLASLAIWRYPISSRLHGQIQVELGNRGVGE